ncbi:MAG TPA: DivIVA domain-containing protein [Solirubrobacteraceae bacterium]|nr:DivIVA domain-containing protein [Solirubrobacteraceae bacterium]
MPVSRSSIQRSDFPTGRRGYDPAAVDAHLRAVAEQVEELSRRSSGQSVAAAASEQVQRIVEAAERTAEQLRSEAGEEAREHVARVSAATGELLERIGALHDELGGVTERLRESASRLAIDLRSLERDVAAVGSPAAERAAVAPEPATVAPVVEEHEPKHEPSGAEDEEAARLVALDMALGGTPREETERYLAQHYVLPEADRLLDDVYARAGQ